MESVVNGSDVALEEEIHNPGGLVWYYIFSALVQFDSLGPLPLFSMTLILDTVNIQ